MSDKIHSTCCCVVCNKPKEFKAKVFDELGPLPLLPTQLRNGALWIPARISLQKAMDEWQHSIRSTEPRR